MIAPGFRWGRALLAGTAASVASALVVAWRSERDTASPWAGLNAISHWLFGARAYSVDEPSPIHAGLGLAIHQASSLFWGVLYEALIGQLRGGRRDDKISIERRPPTAGDAVATAAIVTALAAYTDLRLVPPRLSPGFEHRLSRSSVALAYLAVAGGLAATGVALAAKR